MAFPVAIGVAIGVITTIGEVAGALVNIYQFGKTVQGIFDGSDPDRERYESLKAEVILNRQKILVAASGISSSIGALEEQAFRIAVSDKQGDADQAQEALDNWLCTGSDEQKSAALDRSAGALADMLQFARNGVYPVEALGLPLAEVVFTRLRILAAADPGFLTSAITVRRIEESIELMRAVAASLEAMILATNVIHSRRFTTRVSLEQLSEGAPPDVLWNFTIRYANLSGTVAFDRTISSEPDPTFDEAVALLQREASARRELGIAEDLGRAQVPTLRGIADTAEACLRGTEIGLVGRIFRRELTGLESARYLLARREGTVERALVETLARLPDDVALEREKRAELERLGSAWRADPAHDNVTVSQILDILRR